MERLYKYQQDFKNIAMRKILNKFFFAEIPTGAGKSVISADIAETFAKQGRKVIISTYTNQLVKEIFDVLNNKNPKIKPFDTNISSSITIGKFNYFDTDKIKEVRQLFINPQELDDYIENIKNKDGYYYQFDTLFDNVPIAEDNKLIVKNLAKVNVGRKDYMTDIGDVDISITNYTYLIFKTYDTSFNINDYVVIFDEADKLYESAESALTSSFSVFRLKNLTDMILKNIAGKKEKGFSTGIKNLFFIRKNCKKIIDKYSNTNCVGEYYDKNSVISQSILRELEEFLNRPELKRAEKFVNSLTLPAAYLFLNEVSELHVLKSKQSDVRIYCSPVKGYPTLHFLKKNIASELFFKFWDKLDGCLGMSATLTAGETDEGRNYIYNRLGFEINVKDKDKTERVKSKKDTVYIMPQIFKKEQAKIFICRKKFAPPVKKFTGEVSTVINSEWAQDSALTIINTVNRENALVLAGSFEEVDLIADNLKERGINNVIVAERGKSSYLKVKEFKEKGGILIGTRNYGTGLDLPKQELTKLYITKLPFPVMNSRRFLDLKEKYGQIGFFIAKKEMILNLRQWIGRLIRTKEDKGEIYILDSRIWDSKYYHIVKKTLSNYGIIQNKLI
jgi:Rad3-related DNA helicase